MKTYSVYKHIFPNNKIYIGITSQSLTRRWRNGEGYKDNTKMARAIKKYGWNNIKHEIIYSNLSKQEAENIEIRLINDCKSYLYKNGYNIQMGGNCCSHSQSTKDKLSKKCKERYSDLNFMKKFRNSINNRDLSGNNNGMYGKHHTEETKNKIREKKIGKKLSLSQKENFGKKHRKKVIQLDKDLNIIKEFDSIKIASIQTGIMSQNISYCCINQFRKSGGYYWRYKDKPNYISIYDIEKNTNDIRIKRQNHIRNLINNQSIAVKQLDLNGNFIKKYNSSAEAGRETGICARNIHQVASKTPFNKKGNVRKQAGGFIWEIA